MNGFFKRETFVWDYCRIPAWEHGDCWDCHILLRTGPLFCQMTDRAADRFAKFLCSQQRQNDTNQYFINIPQALGRKVVKQIHTLTPLPWSEAKSNRVWGSGRKHGKTAICWCILSARSAARGRCAGWCLSLVVQFDWQRPVCTAACWLSTSGKSLFGTFHGGLRESSKQACGQQEYQSLPRFWSYMMRLLLASFKNLCKRKGRKKQASSSVIPRALESWASRAPTVCTWLLFSSFRLAWEI